MKEGIPQYVGGFFFDRGQNSILLHLRDYRTESSPGKWALFGGKCEGDETPGQALIREFKEELNVDISEESILPLRSYFNEKFGTQRHIFYIERELSPASITLGEGAGFGWIRLDTVFSYDLSERTREDLRFFLEEKV